MPNRDGTGPRGEGPKTGRGLGNCEGTAKNTDNRPLREGLDGSRKGLGRGTRGRRRGLGRNA